MFSFPLKGIIRLNVCLSVCVIQVLCIGPTGTGKTLTMSDKLLKNMPTEYITHFLMFSARTSANQTQDYIDSKLDKRYTCSNIQYIVHPTTHYLQYNNMFGTHHFNNACACASGGKVYLHLQ